LSRSWDGLVIGEIDPPVLAEAGMESDIVQALERTIQHRRHSSDGLRIQFSLTHDPQLARSFGDQNAAVWKEGQTVRTHKTPKGDDAEFPSGDVAAAGSAGGAVEDQRSIRQRGAAHDSFLCIGGGTHLKHSDRQTHHGQGSYRDSVLHERPPVITLRRLVRRSYYSLTKNCRLGYARHGGCGHHYRCPCFVRDRGDRRSVV